MSLFKRRQEPQPKDSFGLPLPAEAAPPQISSVIHSLCVRAKEVALELGTDPLLRVSQGIWEEIMLDDILRNDMRWSNPVVALDGERGVLYGVRIIV